MLGNHAAHFVAAGLRALLGNHAAHFVAAGLRALLGDHAADFVAAGLRAWLADRAAASVGHFLRASLAFPASAADLLFFAGGNPNLLAARARRCLALHRVTATWFVNTAAGARIHHPSTRFLNRFGVSTTGNGVFFRFPVTTPDLDRLGVLHRLANRVRDRTTLLLFHRAIHVVVNHACLGFPDWLADRVADLPCLGFPNWLADRVTDLTCLGFPDWLADRVTDLACLGFPDWFADRVTDLTCLSFPNWLANRVTDLTCLGFPNRLADGVANILCARFPNRATRRVFAHPIAGLRHHLRALNLLLLANGFPTRSIASLLHLVVHHLAYGSVTGAGIGAWVRSHGVPFGIPAIQIARTTQTGGRSLSRHESNP